MKVLHVITGLSNGGAESILFSLVTSSKEVTHVVISLTDMGFYGDRLRRTGVEVIALNMPESKITFSGIVGLVKAINTAKPDVIQTWLYHANLLGGIVGRYICRKKIVWSIHHATLGRNTLTKITNFVARLGALCSWIIPEKIVCCSELAQKEHIKIGYRTSKLVVVENGFDFRRFCVNSEWRIKVRAEYGVDSETIVLGMVARWDSSKDFPNLVAALECLQNISEKAWRCIFVGQCITDSNISLLTLLSKHGISSRVILAGSRSDIECVMNALDVLVLSSVSESFGNVLVEAMGCGVPVVTTRVGAAEEIVGELGWVVTPRSSADLAAAMHTSIEIMSENRDKWRARQHLCRQRVIDRYGLQSMTNKYIKLWSSISH